MNNLWRELLKVWPNKHYQKPNGRVIERYKYVKRYAPLFEGLDVLDLGCNAALFAIPIIKYARMYTGVEGADKYYEQAVHTKKLLGSRVNIIKDRIENLRLENSNYRGLIVSRVLYYVSDEAIEVIQKQLLPNCKVVLMINGTRSKRVKSNSWDFWKPESGLKFLEGFETTLTKGAEKASYRIIATR